MSSKDFLYSLADSPKVGSKIRQCIVIKLTNGEELRGNIFTSMKERPVDILNDGRPFIPFEHENGNVLILAKNAILSCDLNATAEGTRTGDAITADGKMNPFIFLGIPQNADWEQAQLAYRRLVRTCNSEKIKEDGYHYSIVEFATDVERRAKKAIDDIHKIIFKNH